MAYREPTDISYCVSDQIIIPIGAAIRIFSFVSRNDLENCKLVCKTWKNLIDREDRSGSSQFQKRRIDALVLSTNREFSIKFYHNNTLRGYFYKKYLVDRDIEETETKKVQPAIFDAKMFRFPCGERFPFRVSKKNVFSTADPFHHTTCKNVKPMIYQRYRNYSRKLFTPPLSFYERLELMLHKCKIERLIFHGFTFTDLFVEKLFEYAGEPFSVVTAFVMHCCNLRCISPESFHALLGGVSARYFLMDRLRNCLPGHISAPLFDQLSIRMARTFYVGQCLARHTNLPITFPVDDDWFANYLKSLPHIGDGRREFFGIALCFVTSKYKRTFMKLSDDSKCRRNLFKHVLFADVRCLLDESK